MNTGTRVHFMGTREAVCGPGYEQPGASRSPRGPRAEWGRERGGQRGLRGQASRGQASRWAGLSGERGHAAGERPSLWTEFWKSVSLGLRPQASGRSVSAPPARLSCPTLSAWLRPLPQELPSGSAKPVLVQRPLSVSGGGKRRSGACCDRDCAGQLGGGGGRNPGRRPAQRPHLQFPRQQKGGTRDGVGQRAGQQTDRRDGQTAGKGAAELCSAEQTERQQGPAADRGRAAPLGGQGPGTAAVPATQPRRAAGEEPGECGAFEETQPSGAGRVSWGDRGGEEGPTAATLCEGGKDGDATAGTAQGDVPRGLVAQGGDRDESGHLGTDPDGEETPGLWAVGTPRPAPPPPPPC